jgi:FdhD protein
MKRSPVSQVEVLKVQDEHIIPVRDDIVTEEPLHIELHFDSPTGLVRKNAGVIMRTPGNDDELALGYIYAEGMISEKSDLISQESISGQEDKIIVKLHGRCLAGMNNLSREGIVNASCGVCGRAGIDDLLNSLPHRSNRAPMHISPDVLYGLQDKLRQQQSLFQATGGIHAAGLFSSAGDLLLIREDVGRHNAVDKIVGYAFQKGLLPLQHSILFLSGRAGFELLQKAARAGIGLVASVGATSSLAVETAREAGISLISFLRGNRFNIYTQFDNISKNETKDKGKFHSVQA